jgi:ectoine hydroxylase-related dioxygenase (phytanoyl-CoA dioxygenase family)
VALNKVGHYLHVDHPVFKKFTFNEKIVEVLKRLNYKRPICVQSMVIYKNPGIGGEVFSHQDSAYLYTDPPSCIGMWTPLEDATVQNGCLKAIKGSHKDGVHRRFVQFFRLNPIFIN